MSRTKTPSQLSPWRLRFSLGALLIVLTAAAIGAAWWGNRMRREQTLVTVMVVDAETLKPITKYEYQYSVETVQGTVKATGPDVWLDPKSTNGQFQLRVPPSCEIYVEAKAPGYLQGYGEGYTTQAIRRDDADRRVVLKLRKGVIVRGVVVDEKTGQPLANASISPMVFMPPLFVSDDKRGVLTASDGSFQLGGVDDMLGVEATHNAYLPREMEPKAANLVPGAKGVYWLRIALAAGDTLRGVVTDENGKPLSMVQVQSGRKRVQSDQLGRFTLKSPSTRNSEDGYNLTFEKQGYVESRVKGAKAGRVIQVRMERLYEIRGKVVGVNGKVPSIIHVSAGPGENPGRFECQIATSYNGAFRLSSEETGKHWIGIRADPSDGFAVWEGWIDVQRDAPPMRIELSKGQSVSGVVKTASKSPGQMRVQLIPVRDDAHEYLVTVTAAREFATLETLVAGDGRFHFPHVRPDNYKLVLTGQRITPIHQPLTTGDAPLSLGVLRPQGTGRVTGVIRQPDHMGKGAWDFADGELVHELLDEPIQFKADENGRFEIKNVPVGKVQVSSYYMASADIMDAIGAECIVRENQTTKVVIKSQPEPTYGDPGYRDDAPP